MRGEVNALCMDKRIATSMTINVISFEPLALVPIIARALVSERILRSLSRNTDS